MLRRVHHRTVNPVPRGKHSRFDSVDLHQVDDLDVRLNAQANIQSGVKPVLIWSQSVHGRTPACHAGRRGSLPLGTAIYPCSSEEEHRLDKA